MQNFLRQGSVQPQNYVIYICLGLKLQKFLGKGIMTPQKSYLEIKPKKGLT